MAAFKPGNTAVITGAASGLGFAIAKLCRDHGMHLALLDIDTAHLDKAKETLAAQNPELTTVAYAFDVADQTKWIDAAMYKPESQLEGKLKQWSGVGFWRKTIDTNVFGILNGLESLLPLLLSSPPKSIVITGSKQGITNPPGAGNPAYNASKAAVKSLAEHLAHDMRSDAATAHISVHLLIPGWTWTGLMGNVGPSNEAEVQKRPGAWYPSQVAEALYQGIQEQRFYIVCEDDETDAALDQARMKWGSEDVYEGRPALSRWEHSWQARAEEEIQAEAERRRKRA